VNTLEMRDVTIADAARVAQHRYEHDTKQYGPYIEWLETAIPRGVYLGWLLELEGNVIAGAGMVILEWGPGWDQPNPFAVRVTNVFVEPEHRNQGHARKLVMRCLEETQSRGITHLNLSSTDIARGLYESLGFVAAKNQMVRY
jgi:GNAT superfamily N-acetyltransferase